MSIVDRARNILTTPKTEWPVIAAEAATVQSLYSNYAIILAALPAVAAVLAAIVGISVLGAMAGMGIALVGYIVGLALIYVAALILSAIFSGMGISADKVSLLKLLIYSATPSWLAGVVSAFVPFLGVIVAIAAFFYAIYLIWLGVRPVLGLAEDKQTIATVVIVAVQFALSFIVMAVVTSVMMSMFIGTVMMSNGL